MHRTTILLPHELRLKAQRQAQARGVSLGELIRQALNLILSHPLKSEPVDSFFTDRVSYQGPAPSDLSENHDRHLYGEGS
jgi:hypothetical protein